MVVSLVDEQGTHITDPPLVAAEFRSYYANIYSSQTNTSGPETQAFLQNIIFPQLSEAQVTALEAPLSTHEIATAIASLASAKAPTQDGLPLDFFATCSEVLIPELLKLYNHIFEFETLPECLRQAVIIVIPAPGKNPQYPDSYRPISLLQVDTNILAKVLATRLNPVILSLIHPDQTRFMPGKNTAMNIRRLYMNIQACHDVVWY